MRKVSWIITILICCGMIYSTAAIIKSQSTVAATTVDTKEIISVDSDSLERTTLETVTATEPETEPEHETEPAAVAETEPVTEPVEVEFESDIDDEVECDHVWKYSMNEHDETYRICLLCGEKESQ